MVADYSDHFGTLVPQKPLPPGGHRVVLLAASFQDCTISGSLAGVLALNTRLLEAAGYKVVIMPSSVLT